MQATIGTRCGILPQKAGPPRNLREGGRPAEAPRPLPAERDQNHHHRQLRGAWTGGSGGVMSPPPSERKTRKIKNMARWREDTNRRERKREISLRVGFSYTTGLSTPFKADRRSVSFSVQHVMCRKFNRLLNQPAAPTGSENNLLLTKTHFLCSYFQKT